MPVAKQSKTSARTTSPDSTSAVDAYMAQLKHKHKDAIEKLRNVVCATDSKIMEGVKWNAPSFRTTEYFATTNLRAKVGVGVILHFGAKARDAALDPATIKDPKKLLKWLGKDRAMVEFADADDVAAKKAAFQAIVRQWIGEV